LSVHDRFEENVQRYLDGEAVEGLDERARAQADGLSEAIEDYAARVQVPGPELDRALAAAAALVLAVLGAAVVTLRQVDPAVEATAEAGTILVRFELVAPDAEQVTLAGSFNDWSPEGIALTRSNETGLWTGTVALRSGEHQYMFVIDGSRWIPDPGAHAQVDDGFGQENSVIIVGPRGVVRS
jgi:hypothetical protein